MARKLRVEYPGAIYDVINRGDRREPTFKDDGDPFTAGQFQWIDGAATNGMNRFYRIRNQ